MSSGEGREDKNEEKTLLKRNYNQKHIPKSKIHLIFTLLIFFFACLPVVLSLFI